MAQKLLIVESPNKIKKLKSFLGPNWNVKASVGHISDLAIKDGYDGLGIKDTTDFAPIWRIAKDKKDVVTNLKKSVQYASKVYLATDPDREGEAIADQLAKVLKLDSYERVSFNEISKIAVEKAINNPIGLDKKLVEAQETRRIIDRLYGFKGSETIRKFNPSLLSVGRVQSAGLKIIVDRENEIINFKARKYQEPIIKIEDLEFKIKLDQEKIINHDWSDFKIPNKIKVNVLEQELKNVNPPKPLSTNAALKLGASLGFKAKETTKLLQSLFEKGLVTYIRTDSTNLSKEFKTQTKPYIENELGHKSDISRTYKLAEGAQEGHEAIRPVHIEDNGDDIKNENEKALYKQIISITIASLLESGQNIIQKMQISINDYIFENRSSLITKNGFRDFMAVKAKEEVLNSLDSTKEYIPNLILKDKTTVAPPRYSESSFLAKIEKEEIGRPSTYSSMLSTIQERNYIVTKSKQLIPTEEGFSVIKFLIKFYPEFIEITFTSDLENQLDNVASGKGNKIDILREFWKKLESYFTNANNATEKLFKSKYGTCPKCNSYLRPRTGKYGAFMGCSNYPECKYMKKLSN